MFLLGSMVYTKIKVLSLNHYYKKLVLVSIKYS